MAARQGLHDAQCTALACSARSPHLLGQRAHCPRITLCILCWLLLAAAAGPVCIRDHNMHACCYACSCVLLVLQLCTAPSREGLGSGESFSGSEPGMLSCCCCCCCWPTVCSMACTRRITGGFHAARNSAALCMPLCTSFRYVPHGCISAASPAKLQAGAWPGCRSLAHSPQAGVQPPAEPGRLPPACSCGLLEDVHHTCITKIHLVYIFDRET
jgi:hypothetical protein